MNEREQAMAIREEARELLAQSRAMHESTLSENRKMAYAVSSLVPPHMWKKPTSTSPLSEEEIAQLADVMKSSQTHEHLKSALCRGQRIGFIEESTKPGRASYPQQRDVFDIVHAINVLAMANTEVIYVFTTFYGHTNCLRIHANSADSIYQIGICNVRLLDECVYLDKDDALIQLLAIESQLTELIIEAREAAEVVEEGI